VTPAPAVPASDPDVREVLADHEGRFDAIDGRLTKGANRMARIENDVAFIKGGMKVLLVRGGVDSEKVTSGNPKPASDEDLAALATGAKKAELRLRIALLTALAALPPVLIALVLHYFGGG